MIDYTKLLKTQMDQIDDLIVKAQKQLRVNNGIETVLIRFSKRKNGYQYYYVDKDGKYRYIKKRDMNTVRKILQKEYDEAVLKALQSNRDNLERFLSHYNIKKISDAFERLSEARKILVNPVLMPDEAFIDEWRKKVRGNMNSFPFQAEYQTDNGENVRSKSEKILADLFLKHGIPYCYEPELNLDNGSTVYPDFALLDLKRRKTVYWEHFGLISDGEYAKKALKKLALYEYNDIKVGKDLLYSIESDELPLNIKQIEKKLKNYLLQ